MKIELNDGIAPVYCHLPGQINPCPAFVYYDLRTGALSADWQNNASCMSSDVFNGHRLRWRIPHDASRQALECLAENADFLAMLERVKYGYDSNYGSDWRATYTDDAQQALIELDQFFEKSHYDFDRVEIWDASETIVNLTAAEFLADIIEAGSISTLATDYTNDAHSHGAAISGDIEDAIAKRAMVELKKSKHDALVRVKLAVILVKYDPHHVAQILAMGDSED